MYQISDEMRTKVKNTLLSWETSYMEYVPENAPIELNHKIWACGVVHIKTSGIFPTKEYLDGFLAIHGVKI